MLKQETEIFIFHKSEIIAEGLVSIISRIGLDPIIVSNLEDFSDYPKMLGYVIIIIPKDQYENEKLFFDTTFKPGNNVHYFFFSPGGTKHDEINLEDSATAIQHKIKKTTDLFSANKSGSSMQELSPREVEVLKLVALGYINKEIGDQLSISAHTVISHRKNITEKTGIKTISGLTMLAVLKKIIDINEINPGNLK